MNPPLPQAAELDTAELSRLLADKAKDLFASGHMLCTPAVVTALNQGLGGGLSPEVVNNLTAGLGNGLGGAGCLCGAVSGGTLSLGLFLGNGKAGGRTAKSVATASHELHDQFKKERGSTCCRVLSKKVKHDAKAHMAQCAELTRRAAEMAATAILATRPELAAQADLDYLHGRVKKKGTLARLATAVMP
ncbi:MAG: C-GCAxxG-C-C family protein [Desulfarculaceae bacterium]|nr:C-GCAxxG-C-C family protein [Desulfarculaceae bacterium]MCF8072622.1 C-GCAxxG-C-C family protein [Desulfarculaceae bacterium]MCF8103306.1 C-GCAxxG-C-C family protein [Desulfarculaceae bacterium]MCF8117788.1 C-GCAxxG-C-C family protein [Desulfarculaceae bacterium]